MNRRIVALLGAAFATLVAGYVVSSPYWTTYFADDGGPVFCRCGVHRLADRTVRECWRGIDEIVLVEERLNGGGRRTSNFAQGIEVRRELVASNGDTRVLHRQFADCWLEGAIDAGVTIQGQTGIPCPL
ncbi:MAG: hypothetical protein Q8L48_32995 [Archangium sp.]|nr:hypothetical protein [Archangium sp.]